MATRRAEPKRGQRLEDGKVIHWKARPAVYEQAVRIAEREHLKNADAFSMLLRHGIALDEVVGEVRTYLTEARQDSAEKQSRTERLVYALYEPSPVDVFSFISEAVGEKVGWAVREGGTEAVPVADEKPAKAGEFKVLHWREKPAVYDEAMRITEERGLSIKDGLSTLVGNGIILDDAFGRAREYILAKRERDTEAFASSPLEWERRKAEAQRLLYTLYEPSDLEITQFVIESVREKMRGKVARGEETTENSVDEGTLLISVGRSVLPPDGCDNISVRFLGHCVIVQEDGIKSYDLPTEQVSGRPTAEMSVAGDVLYNIKADTTLSAFRSILSGKTGEYEDLGIVESREVGEAPSSLVLRLPSKEVVINEFFANVRDATVSQEVGDEEATIAFGHNIIRIDAKSDAVNFLIR